MEGGAICEVWDPKTYYTEGTWPEEPRACLVSTPETGEFSWSMVITQEGSAADVIAYEALPNCVYHDPEDGEIIHASTCDFGAAGWASNMDCWYDLAGTGMAFSIIGGFFAICIVVIVLVVI